MTFVDRNAAGRAETRTDHPGTGPRIYNLFPLLVGPVPAWTAELPRIAAMNFDWVYLNPFHETGFSGSLYAVKNPFRLDPRFVFESILERLFRVGIHGSACGWWFSAGGSDCARSQACRTASSWV